MPRAPRTPRAFLVILGAGDPDLDLRLKNGKVYPRTVYHIREGADFPDSVNQAVYHRDLERVCALFCDEESGTMTVLCVTVNQASMLPKAIAGFEHRGVYPYGSMSIPSNVRVIAHDDWPATRIARRVAKQLRKTTAAKKGD